MLWRPANGQVADSSPRRTSLWSARRRWNAEMIEKDWWDLFIHPAAAAEAAEAEALVLMADMRHAAAGVGDTQDSSAFCCLAGFRCQWNVHVYVSELGLLQ